MRDLEEVGALTVAVVTAQQLRGRRRKQAERGIEELRHAVDTALPFPISVSLPWLVKTPPSQKPLRWPIAFCIKLSKGVSDLINNRGMVNVDFADVCTIMSNKGIALMGVGLGSGDNRMIDAAQRAINSPLLDDVSIAGATSVLINVTGSSNIGLREVSDAMAMISEEAHEDVNTIWGMVLDESMGDEVRVTVIATGFEEGAQNLGNAFNAPAQNTGFTPGYAGGNAQGGRMRMSPQGGGINRPAPEAPRIQRPSPGLNKPPQRTLPTQSQPPKRSLNATPPRSPGGQGQRSLGGIPGRSADNIQPTPSAGDVRGTEPRRRSKLPNVEIPDFFGDN